MLEDRTNRGFSNTSFDRRCEYGYLEGIELGRLESWIGIVRRSRKDPETYAKIIKLLEKDFPKENCQDFFAFIEKYPYLNEQKLAVRILQESEYRYIL